MVWLLLWSLSFAQESLPTQEILGSSKNEDFSERIYSAPVQKIKLDALQKTSPTFENIFSRSSEIQARNAGSPGVSIRGSGPAGRTLFLLDNIPLNLLDGFGGSPLFVPTEIIQDIKTIAGPSSTAYGSNALGGTIHFIPTRLQRTQINLGLGESDGSVLSSPVTTSHLSLATPLINNNKNYVMVSGRGDHDRGDFRYSDINGNHHHRQNNNSQQNRWTFYGQHHLESFKITEFILYTHLNKTTPGPESSPYVTSESSHALIAATHLEKRIADWGRWNSRLSFARLSSGFADPSISRSLSDKLWTSHSFSFSVTEKLLSQTFIEASHNTYKATFTGDTNYQRNEFDLGQIFIYKISPALTFEPSFRHAFRYQKGTGTLLIKYEMSPETHIWGSLSEGYRPPSLIDLYTDIPIFKGNSLLRAESSRQFEIGSSWEQPWLTLKSSLFFTQYKDLIQTASLAPGVSTKINSGSAHASGLHTVLKSDVQNMTFTIDHSLLFTREDENKRSLLFSPKQQIFLMANYHQDKWQLQLQQTYWSDFEDNNFLTGNRVKLSVWTGTDVLIDYKFNDTVSMLFGIYNLWDRRRELNYNYPEPQRRFAVALSVLL